MAGPVDFLPPSFWAASISCLFRSSSSICFFLARASASLFSISSFLIFSSSALLAAACFFSCSALISFLAACLSLSLLSPLGSCLLLLLLGPDLLPGGLFVLKPLEFGLLLGPFFPPLRDVLLQLLVHLPLLGLVFGRGHLDE